MTTILHLVCENVLEYGKNALILVDFLLRNGANVNAKNKDETNHSKLLSFINANTRYRLSILCLNMAWTSPIYTISNIIIHQFGAIKLLDI